MTFATDRYHHGDLPNALRAAAVEVIVERGVGGFSLREVARRAGVSHNAPAHHFGDVRGLLASLAAEGFDALHDATSAAAAGADDPVERLAAIGAAYVELARSHPAHCELMFRVDLVGTDEGLLAAGQRAYGVLEGAVRDLVEIERLGVDVDDAVALCWSAMQGLVVLEPKLTFIRRLRGDAAVTTAEQITRFTAVIVAGLRAG